ncbi:hypothetical protein FJ208_01930 [Candidatus Gribaldobacteria bacterium]|nr:hypothetical protein [Candidatus Gribaldobacteria bacterium]
MKIKIDFLKFKGKEIALVKGKVVAWGKSSKEAFEKAKKQDPALNSKDITLLSIPSERAFVYFIK